MIVVDTSVWSLLLRRRPAAARQRPAARELARLIETGAPVTLPGIALQELLSGVRSEAERERLEGLLEPFPLLLATRDHHLRAARVGSACRAHGIAASAVDCLVAAFALAVDGSLFSADRDFERIAEHSDLRLHRPPVP